MRSFLLGTPFFRIFLAFVAGILMFEFAESGQWSLILFVASILFFGAHILFKTKTSIYKLRWLFGCGVFLFFTGFGWQMASWQKHKNRFENLNRQGVFKAELLADPVEKPRSVMLKLQTEAYAADSLHFVESCGNAIVYIPKTKDSQALRIGDKLLLETKMIAPKQNGNPEEFNYLRYLQRKGFAASVYVPEGNWRILSKADGYSIFRLAADCRRHLLEVYHKYGISGDEFAVLAALTLGYQDEIRDELYTSYSNSGALHILSVSGLHVGIIYLVFAFCFSFLNKTAKMRLLKSGLIILFLWVYALITGLSPSVMRAAMMFSLLAFGDIFRYKSSIYNTVFFSASLLLCIDTNFIFDVSYQLSYVAVLGIVLFQPYIKSLLYVKSKALKWCWDLFCVSMAAQIATFPLGMYYFHKFSNHFLLTNFVAIPISTLIIYASVLLFVFSFVPYVNAGLSLILKALLIAQNKSIEFIDHLPFSTFQSWVSEWDVLFLYLAIAAILLFYLRKRYALLFLGLSSLLAVQAMHLWRHYESKQQNCLLVYADSKSSAIELVKGDKHTVFTNNSLRLVELSRAFCLKEQMHDADVKSLHGALFANFEGLRIAIVADSVLKFKKTEKRMKLDYLILTNKAAISMRDINQLFELKTLVIDSSCSEYKLKKLKQDCEKYGIRCYSTKESGALILQIDKKVHSL